MTLLTNSQVCSEMLNIIVQVSGLGEKHVCNCLSTSFHDEHMYKWSSSLNESGGEAMKEGLVFSAQKSN